MIVVAVAIGCGIGVLLRHYLSGYIARKFGSFLPWGTMVVNLTGAIMIGIVYGASSPEEWNTVSISHGFIVIGILGGFTTVSSLSLQTVSLIHVGTPWRAAAYVAATLMLGLLAAYIGIRIGGLWQ